MAVYKVPQDVEAEDKLIGPFGFRQFIYLAIAGGAGFMCYIFYNVAPPLIIVPLPVMALFILIALPLRKEQPMETYLLALIRFYLKPKTRKWNPDGTITYVEIVAPKVVEQHLAKEYGADTASERIDYLARVMDSRGWAMKGVTTANNLSTEIAAEAEHAVDVYDSSASVSQSFASMIAQQEEQRRQAAITQMQQAMKQTAKKQDDNDDGTVAPHYDPYPAAMHQRIIQPTDPHHQTFSGPTPDDKAAKDDTAAKAATATPKAPTPPPAPVPPPVSPDIMRLASNDDLSISAIAHEAHRLTEGQEEVVIKLH
jgi:hypothetical protein